ncbi:hypothetical protein L596_003178 [Steinernema carpocapsae]|uniref:Mitochondrial carrier protein n=1 Tax=Steinernema carpocapsae TaxID=34508 RepID=A0A4U8UTC0_STECR|nr:hypothetical protein L596_003178 [Steinernema carpocapsae]
MDQEALIHFVGGAVGGTAGTCITCPLEVVKTRLQSSRGGDCTSPSTSHTKNSNGVSEPSRHTRNNALKFGVPSNRKLFHLLQNGRLSTNVFSFQGVPLARYDGFSQLRWFQSTNPVASELKHFSVYEQIRHIVRKEGFGALYKGLGPNLVGVAPSKAVYFYVYSTSKRFWNDSPVFVPNSAIVHMISAGTAGFVAASVINPVWLVKTRLQLHEGPITIVDCIRRIYRNEGIRGFYKGVTASYMGISETMIQFVLYEYLRQSIDDRIGMSNENGDKKASNFISCMISGGIAKFIACVIAYPHEVVRTRLREENTATKGFFSTLAKLYNEGYRSMYRGMGVQLMRTVPNTAITLGTYELVVYVLHQLKNK